MFKGKASNSKTPQRQCTWRNQSSKWDNLTFHDLLNGSFSWLVPSPQQVSTFVHPPKKILGDHKIHLSFSQNSSINLSFWPVFLTFVSQMFFFSNFVDQFHPCTETLVVFGGGITGSVLFLENRTELSLSVAPYETPPEGPEKNAFRRKSLGGCWVKRFR